MIVEKWGHEVKTGDVLVFDSAPEKVRERLVKVTPYNGIYKKEGCVSIADWVNPETGRRGGISLWRNQRYKVKDVSLL